MTQSENIYATIEHAVSRIADGAILALGGHENDRHPTAVVREIIRQGKRGLQIAGFRYGSDLDMLARAGCVATINTSPASEDLSPLADLPLPEVVVSTHMHPDVAFARFHAAASDLPYALVKAYMANHDGAETAAAPDIFGGELATAVKRMSPDVAIIHAHAADIHGNVQMDVDAHAEFARDIVLARAAKYVIVSVEQIVSPQTTANAPWRTVLPAGLADCVVEAPYGAHPSACTARYTADGQAAVDYLTAARTAGLLEQWLAASVYSLPNHQAYLNRLGMMRIQAITTKRSAYA
ncbi:MULTISPECIES: CoA transferase subunit A [unclassified Rhizobium]|uniref:CoA transferase subunit A n=1 Tax=unclassified Rhizobium TaxID=2613769 RepID=UPI001ADB9CDA|nr:MULTISPECIES: CoA-transferase [unclassified Rhizobium]MBO9127904.1 hypothetical protein [Rhizobium sp. 16-488-2b]MBO9178298.1 hypothetical protein [Rhizobium sp. 16-488-2a]